MCHNYPAHKGQVIARDLKWLSFPSAFNIPLSSFNSHSACTSRIVPDPYRRHGIPYPAFPGGMTKTGKYLDDLTRQTFLMNIKRSLKSWRAVMYVRLKSSILAYL